MTKHAEIDAILETLRNAFRPLECGVSTSRYKQYLKFRVRNDNGKVLLDRPRIPTKDALDPNWLRSLITAARAELKGQGFELEPWAAAAGSTRSL